MEERQDEDRRLALKLSHVDLFCCSVAPRYYNCGDRTVESVVNRTGSITEITANKLNY